MKILIVEDEILIQKSLQKLLESKQVNVDATASGREAIKLINTNDYDRIICDLMLQDISGFDIIEESKNKYTPKEISHKFVIITAYSSPQVLEKASQYNCMLLNKPFDNIHQAIEVFMTIGSNLE
ncbi:MAG: response regulator [Halobacteriovoraceae bacterium]|jgi:CheY-like chemotaxis protein|nr:response regulator [Halobacteriovoraceae bacterium]